MPLQLIKPTVELATEYLEMIDEYRAFHGDYPYTNFALAHQNFLAFLEELEDIAQGIRLPSGMPQELTYWIIRDANILIGEIRLRPNIPQPYEKYLGHIGVNIRPSQRNKGYATQALASMLDKARQFGLLGVMRVIIGENPATARIIEKQAGKLLRVIEDPIAIDTFVKDGKWQAQETKHLGERWSLYWVDLAQ